MAWPISPVAHSSELSQPLSALLGVLAAEEIIRQTPDGDIHPTTSERLASGG
jgi:hypothetical protein